MNRKQKEIERQLLKDIKQADRIEKKAMAVDTYRAFILACVAKDHK